MAVMAIVIYVVYFSALNFGVENEKVALVAFAALVAFVILTVFHAHPGTRKGAIGLFIFFISGLFGLGLFKSLRLF